MVRSRLLVAALLAGGCGTGSPEPSAQVPVVLPDLAPRGERTLDLAEAGALRLLTPGVADLRGSLGPVLSQGGWHLQAVPTPDGQRIWSSAREPALLLPVAAAPSGRSTLVIEAGIPADMASSYEVGVVLNGAYLGEHDITAGVLRLEVPEGLAGAGMNRVSFEAPEPRTTPDGRKLGFLLGEVRLEGTGPRSEALGFRVLRGLPGATLAWEEGAAERGRLCIQDGLTGEVLAQADLGPDAGSLAPDVATGAPLWLTLSAGASGGWPEDLTYSHAVGYTDLVLVVVDTLRYDLLAEARTPVLDALASESVVFERCFAHAPMTLPSHTALFSSRLPHRSGVVNNGQVVPQDLPLLSSHLDAYGYLAHAAVSLGTLWFQHRGFGMGLDRGFTRYDTATGYDSYAEMTAPILAEQLDAAGDLPLYLFAHYADPHEPYRGFGSGEGAMEVSLDGAPWLRLDAADAPYLEETLELELGAHRLTFSSPEVEASLRLLKLRGSSGQIPFEVVEGRLMGFEERQVVTFELDRDETVEVFAWVSDRTVGPERRDRYLREVTHVDAAIGQLVEQLKQAGRWEDALVVFTSDHGEGLGDHGLAGHVQNLFDEQIHVPLMVKLPRGAAWEPLAERLEAVRGRLVRHVDLAPTLCELLGLPGLESQVGRSLFDPDLVGGPSREVLAQTHPPEARRELYALRNERRKMVYDPEAERFELYDLEKDPEELDDRFDELGREHQAWQDVLSTIAREWSGGGRGETSAEESAMLEALGY